MSPLTQLSKAGVSVWFDDLSRERIETGNLAELIDTHAVVGVTTNPTIFAAALATGERYREQLEQVRASGAGPEEAVFALTTRDVQLACDILAPVHASTQGRDGWVSIEVDPTLARDTDSTVRMARELRDAVDRDNVMIKIPATTEGLPAIAATIAAGISVNATLIFSVERYRAVMDAYLYGLEQALAEGRDLATIASVASFFISRVDTAVDALLDEDSPLRSKAGIANAQLAWGVHQEVFASERAQGLLEAGATVQRPLWASTGVKDPALADTLYVTELVADGCVNTMPEKTMMAFADHGDVRADTLTGRAERAQQHFARLAEAGIDFDQIVADLEVDGISKFDSSWAELLTTVRNELERQ